MVEERGRKRFWLGRHRLDLGLLVLALGVTVGLLSLRAGLRHAAGGLTMTTTSRDGRTKSRTSQEASLFPAPANLSNVRWTGRIWIPRKGKYVFGLQLAGRGRLDLDGRKVLDRSVSGGAGGFRGSLGPRWDVVRNQVLVDRGWHPVTLDCRPVKGGGCRLLWQAPGRRGSPEYIDPMYLRPGAEAPADYGPERIGHRDAWIVTAIFLVWLSLIVLWLRGSLKKFWNSLRESRQNRQALVAVLGWFLLALAVRLFVLGRFGQTWDEDAYTGAGRNYWWNLLALDFRGQSWIWNMEHPPVTKYLAGYGALWTDSLLGPRLPFVFLSAGSVALAWDAGRRLFGTAAAWAGAALLCLWPLLVAHGTIAGHETPSVFFLTAALWAVLVAERHVPDRPWPGVDWVAARGGWYLFAGVAAGMALGTRWLGVAGGMLLGLWLLVVLWPQLRRGALVSLDARALAALVLAAVSFLVIWPWLWHAPMAHLSHTLGHYGGQVSAPEPFLGRVRQAPWYYFPAYLSATVQPLVLFGLAAWVLRAFVRRSPGDVFAALWMGVPLALAGMSPLKQDGIRYVLPMLVPMALAAGDGLVWLWKVAIAGVLQRAGKPALAARLHRPPAVAAVLALLVLASSSWSLASVFPYELDYYNMLWGGTSRVCRTDAFETSWWGEGLVPAARWVDEHAPQGASLFLDAGARHVFVVRTDIRIVSDPSKAMFWVRAGRAVRRGVPAGFVLVHRENAASCPIVEVWRRRTGSGR